MRNNFDKQLDGLHVALLEMGTLLERGIKQVSLALETQNASELGVVFDIEEQTDKKEREIESLCLKLLMQQQPVASDLRIISAALKMITDMERIGDQVADIAEILHMQKSVPYIKKPEHLAGMANATSLMLTRSIDAFVKSDVQLARDMKKNDDVVDALFVTIKKELVALIRSDDSEQTVAQALDFLMTAKYFERIGDHAVNIAEWVIFSLTGEHKHNSDGVLR